MRKLPPALFAALALSARALAEQADPPAFYSPQRVLWAIRCAGPMPRLLAVSLLAIAALTVVCAILYRKAGGSDAS